MTLELDIPLSPTATVAAIEAAQEAAIADQAPRTHLGMSQIGKADERTLWLQFRGCLPVEHSARAERIFRLGDAIEEELARYLRMVPGVALHTHDDDGRQFRFEQLGGHFAGSMDGAVIGLPEAAKTWHVWESKSASKKRFDDLVRKGVQVWSSEYYAQLQCYMGSSGMDRACFMAYCKDDSRIYMERVRFAPMEWDALLVKALRIIESPEPPRSSWRGKDWYEAKWMPEITAAIYWGERLPVAAHCRNCRHSAPVVDQPGALWYCGIAKDHISPAFERLDCHEWIPALVPA